MASVKFYKRTEELNKLEESVGKALIDIAAASTE